MNGSSTTVVAELSGDGIFAVHQSVSVRNRWTVTHIPTLFAVTRNRRTRAEAWLTVEGLRTLLWDWTKSDLRYLAAQREILEPEQKNWIQSLID